MNGGEFSLAPSAEHEELRAWVHRFAAEVIRPAGREWDEREQTPWPVIRQAATIGLYGFESLATFWADDSGLSLPIANEELFWGDPGIAMSIFGTTLAVAAMFAAGTPDQLAEWAPECYGDADSPQVAAFCSSEPEAGSDVGAIRTSARYRQSTDEWVLNGQKSWITNGGIANVHVVTASVDPSLGARGQAAFVVPPGTPGLSTGRKIAKLGLRASHTADLFLDDVTVPNRCLLGGRERLERRLERARSGQQERSQAALSTFELSRPTVGAQAIGLARAAYEYALDYAKHREVFDRPIITNQAIAFTLSDMRTRIDAARLLVWRAAWMARNEIPFSAGEGSMAKLDAGEVAVRVTEQAVQILGGAGYDREHPVERWSRDAKIYTIFEGTSEIQRLVIARAISGLHIV